MEKKTENLEKFDKNFDQKKMDQKNFDENLQEILEIAQKLIKMPSVSPNDGGTLDFIANFLSDLGFKIEFFNKNGVKNLYATIGPGPYFCFAGHVDVVPPGEGWKHGNPYSGAIEDGFLYGRGVNDMKGAIACILVAFKGVLRVNSDQSLAILLTSDEEAVAEYGLKYVVPILRERGENFRVFVLGEPSCQEKIGDVVKIGRRGSMTAIATVFGVQGHIAYPEFADNPINKMVKICADLENLDFQDYDEIFGSTALQITNLDCFNHASNLIPAHAEVRFGVRFNKSQNQEAIKTKVAKIFDKYAKKYEIDWTFHGNAFVCTDEKIQNWVRNSITESVEIEPKFDGKGATSDGRFLSAIADCIEIGFQEKMAHKVDECVGLDDLNNLYKIYKNLILKVAFIE